MTRLRICDACSCHVFVTETHCPFCAAVLVPLRGVPHFRLNPRLSRARRFALAGAVAGLIGCSDKPEPRLEPPYGAPFPNTGGVNGGGGGGTGGGAGGTGGMPETDADGGDLGGDDAGHAKD